MALPFAHKHDPFGEMRGLLRQLDDAFHGFDRPWGAPLAGEPYPPVTLKDVGDELVLQADLPGVTSEHIAIEATAESLTIRGTKAVEPPGGYAAYRRERVPQSFSRSFDLPSKIDLETVSASTKNGVLTIRAAKQPELRPKRIAIGVG